MKRKKDAAVSRENLVIVESAAKAKTIQKYLNEIPELADKGKFTVKASFGHIDNLPVGKIGVDTTKWTAEYEPLSDKKKVIADLKRAVQAADFVYLASDNDLEGECIADHLRDMFGLSRAKAARITFNEITKPALKAAVLNSRWIDEDKVAAQEARRIMDRVVGYELSPLLWRRFAGAAKGLSAGRVQSAALRMLVDIAQAAREHKPEPLWTLSGVFRMKGFDQDLPAKAEDKWTAENEIKEVLKAASKATVKWRAEFSKKVVKQNPPAPFTTSTLQQEAYNRLGLSAKDTMRHAQALYEAGKITYMRTDSTALAEEAAAALRGFIGNEFGEQEVQARVYKTRAANAQEAHEAIRPTHPEERAKDFEMEEKGHITATTRKLYDLIWRRAVASQMAPAVFQEIHYNIEGETSKTKRDASKIPLFHGKTSFLISEGYLRVYSPEKKVIPGASALWEKVEGGVVTPLITSFRGEGDVTRVVGLYNEPSLVKALEKAGIGRPSTYAGILDKLHSKGYVMKGMNPQMTVQVTHFKVGKDGKLESEEETVSLGGKDTDRLVPTSLGERVTEYLVDYVPFLLETEFTAGMEHDLDRISAGKTSKTDVMNAFYHRKFHPAVEAAEKVIRKEAAEIRKEKAKARKAGDEDGERDDKAQPPAPLRNVLKEFAHDVKAIQTRFGPALFIQEPGKEKPTFISLMPFLQWREKTIDQITEKDVAFLRRLPLAVEGTSRLVVLGRYGLYVKDGETNLPLQKELWDNVYDGSIKAKDLEAEKPYAKSGTFKRGSGGRRGKVKKPE